MTTKMFEKMQRYVEERKLTKLPELPASQLRNAWFTDEVLACRQAGMTHEAAWKELRDEVGITRETYYRWLKQARETTLIP